MRAIGLLFWACNVAIVMHAAAAEIEHVDVYRVPGRFGGWPANHGLWAWGDEILVGFSAGYAKDNGEGYHAIDHDRPEEHLLARSLDGGATWTIENPAAQGDLVPTGSSLHGIAPPDVPQPELRDCPGGIDFAHPDFALTLRMTDVHVGPSRFHYSYDRGHNWEGPFRFPQLDTPGIAARTDYIVESASTCTAWLTAGRTNRREGRPVCVRTTDGGKTWQLRGWIGPEPQGFAIMPSTARLAPAHYVTTLRVHDGPVRWIDAWESVDDGVTWQYLSRPVADTGTGNPPSLIRLRDGRLCLTYGRRAKPFGMRVVLSSDGGHTWSPEITLRDDGGGTDLGYPRSVQRPDGKVVVVYYYHTAPQGQRFIGATIFDPDRLTP
ncbi:MAG: glycoside hydrolase [Pirellulales bacterium]|nr:glycoside hydrolase [Pirellulales bacterium]